MDLQSMLTAVCEDKRTLEMFRYLVNGSYIRVVNYHNTRQMHADRFEREVASFAEHFVPVTIEMLDEFFETRVWPASKPGLIPAIYEGWRTHYDVYAKILDKYNFRGWFYIPAYFPDVPVEEQIPYCKPHGLRLFAQDDYDDPRCCMTWDEIRDLAQRHEICCHTGNHVPITPDMSEEEIRHELIDAKAHMEKMIGREVPVFCWRAGEEYARVQYTHKYFEEAGYRYVVSNLKLEKIK